MESIEEYIESLYEIGKLADLMQNIKARNESPVVLVLGAGASIESDCSSYWDIVQDISEKYEKKDNLSSLEDESRMIKNFKKFLSETKTDHTERYYILAEHVESDKPSLGYYCLAELIDRRFFEGTILTTNFDILLECAFQSIGLIYPKDFVVLIPKYHKKQKISDILKFQKPYIKLIKLHGDLYARIFLFSLSETFEFSPELKKIVEQTLEHYVVIVGYSMSYTDFDIARCFHKRNKKLWYVNPSKPDKLQFSTTELDFQMNLDSENITQDLRKKFEENDITLSKDAKVLIKKASSIWLIIDKDKTYTVRKGEKRLNIYLDKNQFAAQYNEIADEHFITISNDAGCFDEFFIRLHTILLPDSELKREERSNFFHHKAKKLYDSLDNETEYKEDLLNQAIYDFEMALNLGFEEKAEVYSTLGKAYRELGDEGKPDKYEKAIEAYSEAIKLDFNQLQSYLLNRGNCYFSQGKYYERIEDLDEEIKNYDKAIEDFESVKEMEPGNPDAIYWLDKARRQKLFATMKKNYGRITNSGYRELFCVNADIARKELKQLVKEDKLIMKGKAGGTYYVLA